MTILAETIPHKKQRYDTCGDWLIHPGALKIRVSDLGNEDEEFCIALHELIEAWLCQKAGIRGEVVDLWDKSHLSSEDPGSEVGCPYAEQHFFAESIERLMAQRLGINWKEYEEKIRNL